MDESWGLKSILDSADDVIVFVLSERDKKILYCNHLFALKTGLHPSSSFVKVWDDCLMQIEKCGEGRTYRYYAPETPFGDDKNVTITRMVWQGGIKAASFMITTHLENKEEQEREIIFNALGESYLSVKVFNLKENQVHTIYSYESKDTWFYKPESFENFKKRMIENKTYIEDRDDMAECLDLSSIEKRTCGDKDGFYLQFRRVVDDSYRWTEMHVRCVNDAGNVKKIVCTFKDIHGELAVNRDKLQNDMIMHSLANVYRSVYLLDLNTGIFTTVKPDELLFGIPSEGMYDDLIMMVAELIPDNKQKKDFMSYFSLQALDEAFKSEIDNIGREYNSAVSDKVNWMTISAFRPPVNQDFENKCVITFMDITEHKRVEAERNENIIAIDVLSSRYVAVFFVRQSDMSFYALRLPQSYRYLEKQYKNIKDAFNQYISAYVLDEYKDILRHNIDLLTIDKEDFQKKEYVFRNVDDKWIRLSITPVPENDDETEYIVAFEDYTAIMNQYEMSTMYSKMLLADYENMYEYVPEDNAFYMLGFDGERLIRDDQSANGIEYVRKLIHQDDADIFLSACNSETVEECINNGKTVTRLYLRKVEKEGYHPYVYGFHYFEKHGKKTVLIMERDADKEMV